MQLLLALGQDTGKRTSEMSAASRSVPVTVTASGAGVGQGLPWLSELVSYWEIQSLPGRLQPQAVHSKKAAAGGAGRQQRLFGPLAEKPPVVPKSRVMPSQHLLPLPRQFLSGVDSQMSNPTLQLQLRLSSCPDLNLQTSGFVRFCGPCVSFFFPLS